MQPITTAQPAVSKTTHQNYVVMMAGTGLARGCCHLLVTSATDSAQARTASRNALGDQFFPAMALGEKELLELADSIKSFVLPLGKTVNTTADPCLDTLLATSSAHVAQS